MMVITMTMLMMIMKDNDDDNDYDDDDDGDVVDYKNPSRVRGWYLKNSSRGSPIGITRLAE